MWTLICKCVDEVHVEVFFTETRQRIFCLDFSVYPDTFLCPETSVVPILGNNSPSKSSKEIESLGRDFEMIFTKMLSRGVSEEPVRNQTLTSIDYFHGT